MGFGAGGVSTGLASSLGFTVGFGVSGTGLNSAFGVGFVISFGLVTTAGGASYHHRSFQFLFQLARFAQAEGEEL